jgi:hypothetical protein
MELKIKEKQIIKEYPSQPKKLTYEDILNKIGMQINNGKLQNIVPDNNYNEYFEENSYIYNKYFKNYGKPSSQDMRPLNIYEYRNMLIQNIIQKHKIRQIKTKKIMIPNQNDLPQTFYNLKIENQNKLFDLVKR